mgnify:CR=1 FL=1
MRKLNYTIFALWGLTTFLVILKGKESSNLLLIAFAVTTIAAGLSLWELYENGRR